MADASFPESSVTLGLEDFVAKLVELSNFRSFSWRELTLLAHYINPQSPGYLNGTRSAELAGFTGKRASLWSTASRTIAKAKAGGLFAIIMSEHGVTFQAVGRVVAECMQAHRVYPVTKDGKVVLHDGGPDHPVRLQGAKLGAQLLGAFDRRPACDCANDVLDEDFREIEHSDSPAADDTTPPAPGDRIREVVGALSVSEYDQTLKLANLVEEAIGLKAEIAEEERKQGDEQS